MPYFCAESQFGWLTLRNLDFICSRIAGVLFSAEVANGVATFRADDGVLHAPGGIATLGTGKPNGSAFDGVLACRIILRGDGHFTEKLFGWHGAGLYRLLAQREDAFP